MSVSTRALLAACLCLAMAGVVAAKVDLVSWGGVSSLETDTVT